MSRFHDWDDDDFDDPDDEWVEEHEWREEQREAHEEALEVEAGHLSEDTYLDVETDKDYPDDSMDFSDYGPSDDELDERAAAAEFDGSGSYFGSGFDPEAFEDMEEFFQGWQDEDPDGDVGGLNLF